MGRSGSTATPNRARALIAARVAASRVPRYSADTAPPKLPHRLAQWQNVELVGLARAGWRWADTQEMAATFDRYFELYRDMDNENDSNAIRVEIDGREAGFMPKEIAAQVAPHMDAGRRVTWQLTTIEEPGPDQNNRFRRPGFVYGTIEVWDK